MITLDFSDMNLSFLLLIGSIFSVISFILAFIILRKVFEQEHRKPWIFISFSVFLYAPAQILRYLYGDTFTDNDVAIIIYGLEFMGHGFLMYGLLLEFFIIKYVKGRFVKMRFIPIQEGSVDGVLSIDVTKSQSYLAHKKDREYMLKAFKEAVSKGYEGFLLTSYPPYIVRRDHGIMKTPILMITNPESDETPNLSSDPNAQSVDALHFNEMIRDIDSFYEQANNPFILIELDEILRYNPFDIIFELLRYLKSKNSKNQGILIIAINEDYINYSNLLRIKELMHTLE